MFWKKQKIKDLLPFPVEAPHAEYSMILSAEGDSPPSPKILDSSLKAIQAANDIDLSIISTVGHYALCRKRIYGSGPQESCGSFDGM